MTQRLCRIDERKPLFLTWRDLHEMFGGQSTLKEFKRLFPEDIVAARVSYPEARVEEEAEGFRFRLSLPPIPKTRLFVTLPPKK